MSGRQVGDAHRGVGRVDALAAGAARAERVDAQILGLDLDVDFLGLGQHGDGGGRGVDAAAAPRSPARAARGARRSRTSAGCRPRLPSMSAMTSLMPPPLSLGSSDVSTLPALPLGVARVHAEQIRRRTAPPRRRRCRRGFRARRSWRRWDPSGTSRTLISASSASRRRLERLQLLLRELAHVGILEQLLGLGDLLDDLLVLAECVDQRLNLGERLRVLAELRVVGLDGRIGHLGHQLLVARSRSAVSLSNTVDRVDPVVIRSPISDRSRVSHPRPAAETRLRRRRAAAPSKRA